MLLFSLPVGTCQASELQGSYQSETNTQNFYPRQLTLKKPKLLLAQFDGDESYDPFADYSEFEEATQEEADIHFFRNGRFFNIGLLMGYRSWTDNLGKITTPNFSWGLYLAYFFDLNFALQISYTSSQHGMEVIPENSQVQTFRASISFSTLAVALKYYFNVQNVTRGLADLNPYVIGGVTMNYQTALVEGENITVQNDGTGFQLGLGIEVPVSRNKMYLGLQAVYHMINLPNEGVEIQSDGDPTGVLPKGDEWNVFFILGVNF